MSKLNCYKANAFVFIGSFLFVTGLFAQTEWTKYEGNPIMETTPIGFTPLWDDDNVGFPCVWFDGTTYKMWYVGSGILPTNEQIGYATSPDGKAWTKYENNPVLKVGESNQWDYHGVSFPVVIFDGTMYKMWYSSNKAIGYATSPDGKAWTKYENNPVLQPGNSLDWDSAVYPGDVIFDGSSYKMWYSGQHYEYRIGFAESSDGINWEKYEGNPVVELGETWDGNRVYTPDVMLVDGTYHMWYTGRQSSRERIGYATSRDGITWTKYPGNPVIDIADDGWDNRGAASPSVILQDNGLLQMWYFGVNGWTKTGIGYATSKLDAPISDVSRWSIADKSKLPLVYTLLENYPNPFNPTTTIRYNLPESAHIRLTIYDQLGRHVRTLVDAQQAAGHFQTTWNGLDEGGAPAAAGMYFCQMKTFNFTKVIKLALVK